MSEYLKIEVLETSPETHQTIDDYKYRPAPFATTNHQIFKIPILETQRLTQDQDVKTVYKLTFDYTGINHDFVPGDTIGIYPSNNPTSVDAILSRLTNKPDQLCELRILEKTTKKNPTIPKHLPVKSTVRNIFLNHVDINTPPKKLFLKSLLRFVTNPCERTKLEQITSPKASKEYTNLITTSCKNLLGILKTFPSCHPSIAVLLEHLPPLLPRPYSISSSPLSGKLEITFFVLIRDDGSKGLCTEWLENRQKLVPLYFRQPTAFRLPQDDSPLILVAAGTGVAPFRAFLQHKMLQGFESPIWLFYGCRYRDKDFLYREEIEDYVKLGVVSRIDLSFSREGKTKKYVQYYIEKNGVEFSEWVLQKGAKIFICGDAKTLVRDVKEAVVHVLQKYGSMDDTDADNFVREMHDEGRFIVDNWV